MKKIFLLSFLMLMGVMNISAQDVQENLVKKTFLTSIHCPNCEARVKNNVATLGEGVKGVEVNLEKKEVTVEFDANKTNVENIIAGFEKINVKAQLLDGEKKCGGCKKAEGAEAKSCDKAVKHCDKEGKECDKAAKSCCKEKAVEATEAKQCCKEKKAEGAEAKQCCKEKKAEAAEAKQCCKEKQQEQAEVKPCCKEKKAAEAEKKDCCKDKKDKKKKK